MKKPKIRLGPFDTLCTEEEKGVWTWHTPWAKWRWVPLIGLNLSVEIAADQQKAVAYVKTLENAVCYAWGFTHGHDFHKTTAALHAFEKTREGNADA